MTDPRVEAAELIDRVAQALEHLRRQWIGPGSGAMPTYHQAAEELVRVVRSNAASPADPHRERREAAPRATFESCVRRVLDRIAEEREDGHELGIDEVEARLRHALTLAATPANPHRERYEKALQVIAGMDGPNPDPQQMRYIARAALDPKAEEETPDES